MIFLDTGEEYFLARSRVEMASVLIAHLDADPDDGTLAYLAAAVWGIDPLDVVVVQTND
ncbi:hypothetical protein [Corynebacterium sp. A21]|uniref:hypothetical protein n=1 Tax=Corynebacterium sp. A21 TaxID=3457318 RepID=UPI003FD5483B